MNDKIGKPLMIMVGTRIIMLKTSSINLFNYLSSQTKFG